MVHTGTVMGMYVCSNTFLLFESSTFFILELQRTDALSIRSSSPSKFIWSIEFYQSLECLLSAENLGNQWNLKVKLNGRTPDRVQVIDGAV